MMTARITANGAPALCACAIAIAIVQAILATAAKPPPPPSSSPSWWAGVLEIVKTNLGLNGAVSGTPSRNSTVTATGTGRAKVDAPVSSHPQNRRPGKRPRHAPTVADSAFTF
jgi:hypothetical protein